MVVDDEEDVRMYLCSALEDAGFKVETAVDGEDALRQVKADPPDLISLDLVMPRKSGAMFHRELQKNRAWSRIPVLIVTGHAKDDLGRSDFQELAMSGPGVYLEKPVSPPAYVRAVRQLLGLNDDGKPDETSQLREELSDVLKGADAATLRRLLDAANKK